MSKTIWKYQFPITRQFRLEMPIGARVLSVQKQNDVPTLWAEVDPDGITEERHFAIVGTGHRTYSDFPNYLGTIQDGNFVWHVYE